MGVQDSAGKAEDWVSDLRETLYDRYKVLSQQLIVLPAHYSKISEMDENGVVSAKLKDLFAYNAGLNIEDEGEFRKVVTENLPPQPNAYEEIRQTNMGRFIRVRMKSVKWRLVQIVVQCTDNERNKKLEE